MSVPKRVQASFNSNNFSVRSTEGLDPRYFLKTGGTVSGSITSSGVVTAQQLVTSTTPINFPVWTSGSPNRFGWVVSASSAGNPPQAAVDNVGGSDAWITGMGLYSSVVGSYRDYTGSVSTTLQNTTILSGEWWQVMSPGPAGCSQIQLIYTTYPERAPWECYLLASNTGANGSWVQLAAHVGSAPTTINLNVATNLQQTTFQYFRIVISKINYDSVLNPLGLAVIHTMVPSFYAIPLNIVGGGRNFVPGIIETGEVSVSDRVLDTQRLGQGTWLGWNESGSNGMSQIICKSGALPGGFAFIQSTGDQSELSVGKTTLMSITPSTITVTGNLSLKTSGAFPSTGQLGNVVEVGLSDTTLVNGTTTQIGSITIPYGVWVVCLNVQFRGDAVNSWVETAINFGTTSLSIPITTPSSAFSRFNVTVGGIGFRSQTLTRMVQVSSSTTYFLNAYSNFTSATAMRVSGSGSAIQIIRIA